MKRPSLTTGIAALLLCGAGAVVLYKAWPEKVSSPDVAESVVNNRDRGNKSSSRTPDATAGEKWKSLTNDNLSPQVRLDLARQIDTDLSPSEIDLLFASLRHIPAGQGKESWWLVMNEIMEQMRRKGVWPRPAE